MSRKYVYLGAAALLLGVAITLLFLRTSKEDLEARAKDCDAFLAAYEQIGKFNGCALIAKDGEVLLRKGYGIRNAQLNEQHDANSIFRIYSITKSFTSTVVMQLVEEGRLSLDDKLSKFYPEVPKSDEITIRHLLTHSSGLYEFTREPDFENSEANLVELVSTHSLDFPPGEGWSYCNSGYCMLGHIIGKVCESSYEAAVTERVLRPLEMNDTGFLFNDLKNSRKAVGYGSFSNTQKAEAEMPDEGGPFAAGALYSTVDDLWRFQQALNNGELLAGSSLKQAWAGADTNPSYGLGWQLGSRWFMRKVVSHSGGAAGFRSNLSQIESLGYTVILLNNHEHANVEFLTNHIYDILDGKPVYLPEELPIELELIEPLVGFYELVDHSGIVQTYLVDERLCVDFRGTPQGSLLFQGDNLFLQPESGVEVEFEYDDAGKCVGLIAIQNGMEIPARKYEGAWGIPESTESKLEERLSRIPEESEEWHEVAFQLAHLYAHQSKTSEYDTLCSRILKYHGTTESPRVAERTVKVCLLDSRGSFADRAGVLADSAYVTRAQAGSFNWGGNVPWHDYLTLAKGIADFRRGDFAECIPILEQSLEFSSQDLHSECVRDLFLVMAYEKTEQNSKAAKRLMEVQKKIDALPQSYASGGWNDRILVDLLERESLELIENSSSTKTGE